MQILVSRMKRDNRINQSANMFLERNPFALRLDIRKHFQDFIEMPFPGLGNRQIIWEILIQRSDADAGSMRLVSREVCPTSLPKTRAPASTILSTVFWERCCLGRFRIARCSVGMR